jgi:adenosylhomocysteine nucleosidase
LLVDTSGLRLDARPSFAILFYKRFISAISWTKGVRLAFEKPRLNRLAADDLVFDEPCILFALPREAKAFLREFPPQQRLPDAPCWAQFCGPSWLSVLVLQTGMGCACVEKALAWLDGAPRFGDVPCRPKLIVSAGFAGGLTNDLRAGDLIVATELCTEDGVCLPAPWPGVLTGAWSPEPLRGRILTVAAPVARTEQKAAMAQKYAALAVDMESALVARWCSRKQIPFGSVRVISDDAQTSLSPELQTLLARGQPSILQLVSAGVRSPRLLRELIRLAGQTRWAGKQLGKALGELLTLTLPFGADL